MNRGPRLYQKNNARFRTPQDVISRNVSDPDSIRGPRFETITMYSRPTAFGLESTFINNVNDSFNGYNWLYTPPYYHGEGWADIYFTPTESKKYTISEIIASSSVEYHRYHNYHDYTASVNINAHAMQLSASVNLLAALIKTLVRSVIPSVFFPINIVPR